MNSHCLLRGKFFLMRAMYNRLITEPIIGSGPTGRTITATITYKKKRLIFEVDYSDIASQFVRMVSKAVENASYRTFPSSDYHWVEVYKNSSK